LWRWVVPRVGREVTARAALTSGLNQARGRQVIVEKMLDHLRSTSDEVQKADVAKRVGELAERFAPDTQWFIDTMNQARPGAYCRYLQDAHS